VSGNLDETSLEDAWRPLCLLLFSAGALLLFLRPLARGARVAALGGSVILEIAFTFDAALQRLVRLDSGVSPGVLFGTLLVVEMTVVAAVLGLLRRHGGRIAPIIPFLNIMAAVLVLFPIGELTWFAVRSEGSVFTKDSSSLIYGYADPVPLQPGDEPLRDIYLIVLDAYARDDVLRDSFGHDNGDFLGALQARGFYIADRSYTNYISTKLVLPSLLNMRYLDYLTKQYGKNYRGIMPLVRDTQHNRVVSSLRSLGYRIVNITADVSYAALPEADEVIEWKGSWWQINPFETALLGMTPLRRLGEGLLARSNVSPAANRRQMISHSIEELGRQGRRSGPKFVFAHILSPHDPFVFGPEGEERLVNVRLFHEYGAERARAIQQAYVDQIHYLNGRILVAIDRILEDSQREPIIAMMGDHGLRLYLRERPEASCLKESYAILNTLYLPDRGAPWLRRDMSPVNTFRTIFDAYFRADMGQLPDKAFFAHRGTSYYDYPEVTATVETCSHHEPARSRTEDVRAVSPVGGR
jgi:hypothetical protein